MKDGFKLTLLGSILSEQQEALSIARGMIKESPSLSLWQVIGIMKNKNLEGGCVVLATSALEAVRNATHRINMVFPVPACAKLWSPEDMRDLKARPYTHPE